MYLTIIYNTAIMILILFMVITNEQYYIDSEIYGFYGITEFLSVTLLTQIRNGWLQKSLYLQVVIIR